MDQAARPSCWVPALHRLGTVIIATARRQRQGEDVGGADATLRRQDQHGIAEVSRHAPPAVIRESYTFIAPTISIVLAERYAGRRPMREFPKLVFTCWTGTTPRRIEDPREEWHQHKALVG